MIKRTIQCEICKIEVTEKEPGYGFQGWSSFTGIKLDGVDNPTFCPEHKGIIADFIDKLKQEYEHDLG